MTDTSYADLGWTTHFVRQADAMASQPLRISEIHRNTVSALSPAGPQILTSHNGTGTLAVGDWVLAEDGAVHRILDRQSLIKRRGAGTDVHEQLIAANITTLGIVSSCNADFNERRLERYLVLAADAGCLPLVILTKADQTDDPGGYVRRAERLSPLLTAVAIDATDPIDIRRLHPWVRSGDTLALVGSSGVGKTTIRNALTGETAAVQTIREDDAKGRHTTTSRALVRTLAGGWLIDTPGMRALRLTDASEGIDTVFSDIEELSLACRFRDCGHGTEPGCAVLEAIAVGNLEPDRLRRWRKLRAENQHNTETVAQSRARKKEFGKMVKSVMKQKRLERDD